MLGHGSIHLRLCRAPCLLLRLQLLAQVLGAALRLACLPLGALRRRLRRVDSSRRRVQLLAQLGLAVQRGPLRPLGRLSRRLRALLLDRCGGGRCLGVCQLAAQRVGLAAGRRNCGPQLRLLAGVALPLVMHEAQLLAQHIVLLLQRLNGALAHGRLRRRRFVLRLGGVTGGCRCRVLRPGLAQLLLQGRHLAGLRQQLGIQLSAALRCRRMLAGLGLQLRSQLLQRLLQAGCLLLVLLRCGSCCRCVLLLRPSQRRFVLPLGRRKPLVGRRQRGGVLLGSRGSRCLQLTHAAGMHSAHDKQAATQLLDALLLLRLGGIGAGRGVRKLLLQAQALLLCLLRRVLGVGGLGLHGLAAGLRHNQLRAGIGCHGLGCLQLRLALAQQLLRPLQRRSRLCRSSFGSGPGCLHLVQPLLGARQRLLRLCALLLGALQLQLQRRQLVALLRQLSGQRIKPLSGRVLLRLQLAQALQQGGRWAAHT